MYKLLYVSPHNIRVTKSRRMRWAGHVAYWPYIGRREMHAGFWWRNPRMRNNLEDPGVYLEDNIKMVFKK